MKKTPPPSNTPHIFKQLGDLKKVKKLIAMRAQALELEKKLLQEQKHKEKTDQNIFRQYAAGVTPLKQLSRALTQVSPPPPVPMQRQQDDLNVMQESLSDEFNVETLLDTDDALSYRRAGIGFDVVRKLRRGHWRIQDQIDLHGYRRDEARQALNAFIHEAVKKGLRCIRVVHGKGHGSPGKMPVLKERVLSWLVQKNDVLAYTQARAAEGGAGAVIVLLQAGTSKK